MCVRGQAKASAPPGECRRRRRRRINPFLVKAASSFSSCPARLRLRETAYQQLSRYSLQLTGLPPPLHSRTGPEKRTAGEVIMQRFAFFDAKRQKPGGTKPRHQNNILQSVPRRSRQSLHKAFHQNAAIDVRLKVTFLSWPHKALCV